MKPENRQIFEENRIHHETLVKAGYMKHLSGRDRSNLVKAMSEEFQPGYSADLWCPPCVSNMMLQVYRRYDEFLEQERREAEAQLKYPIIETVSTFGHDDVPATETTVVREATEEEKKEMLASQKEKAIQTKANFPSHKNHPRR